MLHLFIVLQSFVADRVEKANDRGATAVEYGLLVALIAAVIVATVALLGTRINTAFQTVLTAITPA